MTVSKREKVRFFVRNLLRGVVFLVVIIGGFILAKKYGGFDLKEWMGPLYESPRVVYTIFFFSEVVFGVIPPEFFMIWAQRHGDVGIYISNVVVLMSISYLAGVMGYWFGVYLDTTKVYLFVKKKVFGKFEKQFFDYGGFLVVVASITPIPFSGICMLVGSFNYPFKRFLFFALARFIRFVLYAYIIWETQVGL